MGAAFCAFTLCPITRVIAVGTVGQQGSHGSDEE